MFFGQLLLKKRVSVMFSVVDNYKVVFRVTIKLLKILVAKT